MNFFQLFILILQGTLVSFLILTLFHFREKLGLGLLFACLGLFQFMQAILASTVYVQLTSSFLISPGTAVIFPATLFIVLIIYIKEDANETLKIIYALLITNVVMSLFIHSFGWSIKEPPIYNPFNISTNFFDKNAWVLFIGTIALFLDSVLIIVIYEFTSKYLSNLFLKICLTMLTVLCFDAIFFSIIAFWNYDNLSSILTSGLITKGIAAIFYSVLFSFYFKYVDKREFTTDFLKINDVFKTLTYRQKFEIIKSEAIKSAEEVKLKEIKYQTLTNSSTVGIFHTRNDGYTTFVNPKWTEISGLPMNEALGFGWLNVVHPNDIEKINTEWALAISESRASEIQYRFILKDGSIKWVLGRAVPEINDLKEVIGYVGTITDITNIKLFEQEQILLKEKAQESDRLKSAFLANMSHEIRTPMNGILGFASLLKEAKLSGEQQKKYIKIIEKSGVRMLKIINDIVNISKIESGILDINLTETNINNQLQFIYESLKLDADNKKLKLSYSISLPEKEAIIITDKEKLYGILTNLVTNAIKYTNTGEIEFGCTKKKDEFNFFVKDTGIGIPKEKLNIIFDRFIQSDIDDKMAQQGAGLGLAISRAYVEILGGKIWVESKEAEGSTFFFKLPLNIDTEYKRAMPVSYEIKKIELIPGISDLKVLIAEDDEASVMILSLKLQKFSKEILTVSTGIEAIETCRKHPDIDLILMDIQMPKLNGYEAIRQIREFNKNVVIIAQTAFALTGDKEKAIEAGSDNYISKPIMKDELLKLIQTYFKK
ncbi:ATP-binding protein [Croceitalea sp. P059]|uniref:hybrid sensor histidine kinase/response regulator n=1 Tax=Croceitalea sp. P059 TaxID=3075601 RepID=UPI0028870176|nr:ATP-binding protein [Croceitalea sp. P059]MDT0540036.1 ATP-binding protein [Croceitalea sp. P059]